MSGILQMIRNGANALANQTREAVLTPQEIRERQQSKGAIELLKLASIVSAVATFFFFTIFPSLFTFAFFATVAYGAFEVHTFLNNCLEMQQNVLTEMRARLTQNSLIEQLTKKTPVMRKIFEIVQPDLRELVFLKR